MTRAAERRELGFERAHLRTKNELAVVEDLGDRGVDGRTQPAALRGHVNKWDRRIGAQIHRMPVEEAGSSTDDDAGTLALRRRHHGRARRQTARRDFKAGHRLLARHGRCIP